MEIPVKKKSYSQKYRKEWEDNPDFKDWFAPVQGTDLKNIHRTKCSEIINEVLGPHFKESLRLDIADQKYSLILDESTDISVSKNLGIAFRYFSNSQNKVLSTFLALTPIPQADANVLAEAIIITLNDNNLKIKNSVGIGTDNASVMTGVNNGLYQILKTMG
ncbi:unnamed protein product [Diatraea saccharalis]|uniref:DUF4371 domain-containing protein n=1 Tax=Diatraea saccharalis TaxID=40085 RepID=A0A9N9WH14_9NEOP|nr:unnamed protein product [Diatraea saccharalis]